MNQNTISRAATRPSDLKLSNRYQILELFKTGCVYSVADIARKVGISRQTVMKAVQFFLEKGIIVSGGKASSGSMGGKRAELFSLSDHRYLFNILICPSCLYIALMTLRCEVIDSATRPEISEMNLESIVELTGQCCEALMADHGVKWEDVQGICISTSGVVIREANRVRYNSLFPEWGKDIPLAEMVAKRLDTKALIITENVGKVCGSAFLRDHSVDNARVAAVFSRWGGIVASLMDNGRIVGGKDSLIGEIGHMIIEPDDGEACGCGSRGCFERQVSVERLRAMAAKWQGDFPESPLAKMPEADFTIQKVFELSQAGDALARRLSDYAAHHFAIAMRNLALLFNPDWVVFQGDYADADEHFLECFYRELRQFRYFNDAPGTDNPFVLRTDKRSIADLTTIGAYTLLIDRLFSSENTIQ